MPGFFDCCRRNSVDALEMDIALLPQGLEVLSSLQDTSTREVTSFGVKSSKNFEDLKNSMKIFFNNPANNDFRTEMIKTACAGNKKLSDFYRDAVITLSDTLKQKQNRSSRSKSLLAFQECVNVLLDAVIMHGSKGNTEPDILTNVLACEEFDYKIKGCSSKKFRELLQKNVNLLREALKREASPGKYFSLQRNFTNN